MNPSPSAGKLPWGAIIGIVVLVLVGGAMLAYSIVGLMALDAATPTAPASTTAPVAVVVMPTQTQPPTQPPSPAPSDTPPPPAASDTPAPTGPTLNINLPANVRSGPGLNYSVIGGLQAGTTAPAVGRDSTGTWFVVTFSGAQGWVSNLVAAYTGDANALPVIAAPPLPATVTSAPPTAPPAPAATNTPSVSGSRGIIGNYFRIRNTVARPGEDVWFEFQVTNTTGERIPYGALAAHTDVGPTAQSWTNDALGPNQVLTWEDHINIGSTGTYQVYLGICYGGRDACLASQAPWERLSPSITVTIQ